ncbi:sugar ABC transporter substrate-binding protein [Paenibacillus oralis]|uniref:Sugar ABC transporter substrate-binding protein n=1 Tax=Paenibacillus oralis TaxID=2490856 RepID=A0A3P3U5X0_9BACL|nr:sugar ABC transporter substrate-binding protein [Paenibacillus oralis]RRJ65675.1 sugar ABC transporter substrate-binding protein [Paenibacillus oralis]
MKKHFFKFSLIALTVLALSACGNGKGTEAGNQAGSGNGGGKDGTYSFAFLTNTQNNTFQTAMNDTFERLAKEKGYKYTMLDPDYDLNKQINQMSDAANQGFDAVFVIPVDSAGIRQGLEAMHDRNIPVFNVDTAVIKEDRDLVKSIIATDAYMAGKLMGEQMVKDYPDGAQIAILDFPSNESCVQRVAGFMDGLGENASKFKIVAQQDGKAALDASLPIAEDIIQANADIDAFFAINDPSALGVAAAIKASGRTDIGVYSIDASPDGKAALLDGSFTAVSAQVPIQIAETSFNMAVDYLQGKEIKQEVLLPSHIVTKEMAEETAGKWQ